MVYRPGAQGQLFLISMIHSLNAFFCVLVVIGLNNMRVNEDKWTVGNEIALISAVLLMIGISQFLVRDLIYDNPDNWSMTYFLEEVRNTFLVGLLFAMILVPLNYLRLMKGHLKSAQSLNRHPLSRFNPPNRKIIPIVTQQKVLTLNSIQMRLFLQSEGNYMEIYFQNVVKRRTKF